MTEHKWFPKNQLRTNFLPTVLNWNKIRAQKEFALKLSFYVGWNSVQVSRFGMGVQLVIKNSATQLLSRFFVLTPLVGRGTIYSNGFFVQTILADRYIHRREMWVVSLKSWPRVEFEIKKIFFNFVLSRFKVLCQNVIFCSLLAWFFLNLA